MLIYEPSSFTIKTDNGEVASVREGTITVGTDSFPIVPILSIKPTFNHSILSSLIENLEYVFKGNVQIPLSVLNKRWVRILTNLYNAKGLPDNIIIGNNRNGAYIEIVTPTVPLKYYIWSVTQSTFIPYEGEINYDKDSARTIVSRGLQLI